MERPVEVDVGPDVVALVTPSALEHILDVLADNALVHGKGRVAASTAPTPPRSRRRSRRPP
jgi:hypothetical protein